MEEKMAEAVLRRPEWSRLQIGLNGFMLPDFLQGGLVTKTCDYIFIILYIDNHRQKCCIFIDQIPGLSNESNVSS